MFGYQVLGFGAGSGKKLYNVRYLVIAAGGGGGGGPGSATTGGGGAAGGGLDFTNELLINID